VTWCANVPAQNLAICFLAALVLNATQPVCNTTTPVRQSVISQQVRAGLYSLR